MTIQIKEAHHTEWRYFSAQLRLEKVMKLNEIKKEQQIKDNCVLLAQNVNE